MKSNSVLLSKAAEAEQQENYPAAFIAYKHALLASEEFKQRQSTCASLNRVSKKMKSWVKALENYEIELILGYNDNKSSYRFCSRQDAKQICDLVLPEK